MTTFSDTSKVVKYKYVNAPSILVRGNWEMQESRLQACIVHALLVQTKKCAMHNVHAVSSKTNVYSQLTIWCNSIPCNQGHKVAGVSFMKCNTCSLYVYSHHVYLVKLGANASILNYNFKFTWLLVNYLWELHIQYSSIAEKSRGGNSLRYQDIQVFGTSHCCTLHTCKLCMVAKLMSESDEYSSLY